MRICGPKLSVCGVIISCWGIIQLILMGFFYSIRSLALSEDINGAEDYYPTAKEWYAIADKGYTLNALNCWIAACLYLFTLIISGQQLYMNTRQSIVM